MKNVAITIFIILIVAVLGLYLVSFQVRETESALVTTFGRPTRQIIKPGLRFKWPAPIQRVHKFDSRMRVFEVDLRETTTKGIVPIMVNTYVVWKIAEPLNFYNAFEDISKAEDRLRSEISDTQNVIGEHRFSDFVNSDPNKIKFKQIEQEMLVALQKAVADANYGIEIKTLGIKQLKIDENTSEKVFDRMRAERNTKYEATIAKGTAEATKIKADANSKKTELLATAESRAEAIRAEGDTEAAQYYRLLEADPQFAMFLQDMKTLKKTLQAQATLVFNANSEPFKWLGTLPDFKPREPNEYKEQLSLSDDR